MLGSRKLLIFGIVSALVLSLLIVGASAEEVVRQDFAPVLSRSLRQPTYLLSSDGIEAFRVWLEDQGYIDSNQFSPPVSLYLVIFGHPNQNVPIETCYYYATSGYLDVTNGGVVFNITDSRSIGFDSIEAYSFFVNVVGVSADDFIADNVPSSLFGNAISVFSALLGVGSQFVSFVIVRPIVLLPIVAMILVLSYGVIRRLIKGV